MSSEEKNGIDKHNEEVGTIRAEKALQVIHSHIDSMQKQLDQEFEKVPVIRIDQETDYFMCENKFWDMWFQKLFAQLISVKIWVIILITVLLTFSLISSVQFASILGIIMGMKGVFNTAAVWKEKTSRNIIDRV